MDQNPYESPQSDEPIGSATPWYRRKKPLWGYPVAAVVGAVTFTTALGWLLAAIDDAGFTQMLIGAFLGLVIYAILF